VIRRIVPDNQTAILQLKAGDVDIIEVSVDEIGQVKGVPGITVLANLPSAWLMKINFVMNIAASSGYIGDGQLGPTASPGTSSPTSTCARRSNTLSTGMPSSTRCSRAPP